jgi:uncharacterized protein YmfQ (DUF2313 family)
MGLNTESYQRMIEALLPSGKVWNLEQGSVLSQLIAGCAEELARIDNRANELLTEILPNYTNELLGDWERVAGLPDPCSGPLPTVQQRRAALISKLISTGGCTPQYFIDVAAALGFATTIEEFKPFKAGESAAGQPANGAEWQFAWKMTSSLSTIFDFRAGQSSAGEPLRAWGNEILECAISRIKPAHTVCLFAYV